ncbi:hypothetical protein [Halostreptopolyspora alba]|uniref:hypothetical protein n=1 Tax=Halostreptopolyspora alba TaxID=2487137 RepID=UPI0011CE4494
MTRGQDTGSGWKRVLGYLGALVLGAAVVLVVWRPDCPADPEETSSSSATASEARDTGEYWTEERMRDAEPAPMAEPSTPWWRIPCW